MTQLSAWGISVIFGTLTPCSGYTGSGTSPEDACTIGAAPTVDVDNNRSTLNSNYLLPEYQNAACPPAPCVLADDFDGAVSDGASPEALVSSSSGSPGFDSGDHVNLNSEGYTAVTGTISIGQLQAAVPQTGY